jgi:hypothetical protein
LSILKEKKDVNGMRVVSGQVRASSNDGKDTVTDEIKVDGWKPNSWVHLAICGWSVEFKYGDHPVKKMGMWLQQSHEAQWDWAMGLHTHGDGSLRARFYVFAGSNNMDNPYDFLINYILIGE